MTIIPRMLQTEIVDFNDTSLDVGALGFARSFSLPIPMSEPSASGPENYEFNGSTPVVLYSSMPVTTWIFSDAIDDGVDYHDEEEEDYELGDISPQSLLTRSTSDLEPLANLDAVADDTLEETVTTKKSVHKTTKKRKTIKKKHRKRKTNKKHKAKSTKSST